METADVEVEWESLDALPQRLGLLRETRFDEPAYGHGRGYMRASKLESGCSRLHAGSAREGVVHEKDAVAIHVLADLEVVVLRFEPHYRSGTRFEDMPMSLF